MRLDIFLLENNYFTTRSKAQNAIKEKKVKVNGLLVTKSGFEVENDDVIEVDKDEYEFVSRGGFKLLKALQQFNIDLSNKVVCDIGASTGGFSDCCLQFGAKKVYAYDVGHDQLDLKIKNDVRVISKEGINCRNLTKEDFIDSIDFVCMDVSFISCCKMFDAISNILSDNGLAVILFKPQFEVGNRYLNRQGIVTSDKIVKEKMADTIEYAKNFNLNLVDYCSSPIKGGDGNSEYLLYFRKG